MYDPLVHQRLEQGKLTVVGWDISQNNNCYMVEYIVRWQTQSE